MDPRKFSRHSFTIGQFDADGRWFLTRRERFGFVQRRDNVRHVVVPGDTVWNLAGHYFRGIDPERACGLFWIICDFQPDPIIDSTIRLVDGQVLIIPSERTVLEEIFDEARHGE